MSPDQEDELVRPGRRLRQDAAEIRSGSSRSWQRPLGGSVFRQLLIALVLLGCLVAAGFLAASEGARLDLIDRAATAWLSSIEQAEIYQLPPPPPRVDMPQIVVGQVPMTPVTPPQTVPIGGAVAVYSRREAEREEPYTPPSKDAAFEQAYALLTTQSEVIQKLAAGEITDLRLEGWEPLRADPPSYWMSLRVLNTSTGEAITLAWSVDMEESKTQPQNQAARDLFFKLRRRGS